RDHSLRQQVRDRVLRDVERRSAHVAQRRYPTPPGIRGHRSRCMRRRALPLGVLSGMLAAAALIEAQGPPLYRQAAAPVDARVADLLGRMTIEEKVAQLLGVWNRK